MIKILKIFLISLASVILVVVIAVSIVFWFVLTPEKLTPIVRNQASKYIHCKSEIGQVELTFFSTFPEFGLKANRLTLINPVEGAPDDTLVSVNELIGIINISTLIKNRELIVNDLRLSNGTVSAFIDSLGHSNFDIFPADTASVVDTAQTGLVFKVIDIHHIDLKNVDVTYLDRMMGLKAEARHLSANISGVVKPGHITGAIEAKPFDVSLEYQLDSLVLKTEIHEFSVNIAGSMEKGVITGTVNLKPFNIHLLYRSGLLNINSTLENLSATVSGSASPDNFTGVIRLNPFHATCSFGNDVFLQNDVVQLNAVVEAILSRQYVHLKEASVSVNKLKLDLAGTVENDTLCKNMMVDVLYKLSSWPVKDLIALVPPSFSSYVKGIDADGQLSSEGTVKGNYNKSSFPVMDIRLLFEKGRFRYDAIPVPLHGIHADVNIHTDMKNPRSNIRINRFVAQTPQSTVKTAGTLRNLFTDIRVDLDTEMELSLPEFTPLIPDSMKINATGMVSGKIKTGFSMSQARKMQLEKMQLSGSLLLSGLAVTYDSLSLKSDQSFIDFTLPNPKPANHTTGFVFANIRSESLEASKVKTFRTSLRNAEITLEASDVRDSTKIPDIWCVFKMDDLSAGTDSMSVSIAGPTGKMAIAPRKDDPKHPKIGLAYQSNRIQADIGSLSAITGKLAFDVNVVNDPTRKDIVLQWTPKGFIDLEQGKITMSSLSHPIEVPAIKMKFEPESFAIEKGGVVIGNSAFNISGKVNNVSSYFRGDSLLRGDFEFVSEMTDILQIMNLTNGMGHKEAKPATVNDQKKLSSAYLVPKGMDLVLHTHVKNATYGEDITVTNIKGDVKVHDGILVLDDLAFTTPAADMQLTAMYRTPRKNHLFVGMDLHMFDVEIGELLQMIPAIDSIMPMLRSFGGKGEFHIAVETYVDSMYRVKMSTIRGSSSIRSADLVLMDGQTFGQIARKLRFNKKTINKVDSLSAEFTVFKNEVDVYPFLIVMDKYKAVVGGRHNLDMTYDYNISIVQSPLPFRLAVDVKGAPDDMDFDLGRSKYPDFYRPVSRKVVESKQLELRKLIRDALLGNIIKDE